MVDVVVDATASMLLQHYQSYATAETTFLQNALTADDGPRCCLISTSSFVSCVLHCLTFFLSPVIVTALLNGRSAVSRLRSFVSLCATRGARHPTRSLKMSPMSQRQNTVCCAAGAHFFFFKRGEKRTIILPTVIHRSARQLGMACPRRLD
jgi:hypothetical protein